MTISLQISGAPLELVSVLSLISGITPVETPQVPFALPAEPKKLETPKAAKAETAKPKAATNVESVPATTARTEPEPAKEEPKQAAPVSLTVEMIRAEAARIKDTKRAELQALLAEFSTNSITNLSPGNYQAFYLRIKEL